jgi:hypothetical protein
MFQHGTAPDEIDVLLGQQILPQKMDERAKPFSFPSRQYDSAKRISGNEMGPVKGKHLPAGFLQNPRSLPAHIFPPLADFRLFVTSQKKPLPLLTKRVPTREENTIAI